MAFNPNIHHRRSIRIKGYDYSKAGFYFITICTHDRKCLFGEITWTGNFLTDKSQSLMVLTDAGKIANECWLEIPQHFPNAVLHAHIVMPNHIHGIIELTDASIAGVGVLVGVENFQPLPIPQPQPQPETQPLPISPSEQRNESPRHEFQKMIPRSISSIVKGFKIGVTVRTKTLLPNDKIWQRNFYEHIIRNEQSYQNISEYIINNPAKWLADRFFK